MFHEFKKSSIAPAVIKQLRKSDRLWLFSTLVSIATLYLGLIWKTTGNIDSLTTDCLFWGAILWLLWKKRNSLKYDSNFFSSFVGLFLLALTISKAITLFSFESILLPLFPLISMTALALIASGFKGIFQYIRELFFAWFLFFPTGVIGRFVDGIIHITIINAKISTYLLYYLGFDVKTSGNEVILNLQQVGMFKAIVDYPCAGVPMILLILKLALLLINCVNLNEKQKISIPIFSLILGFMLGVIRVCLLTILIPNQSRFEYWHGVEGSQIFSTLAIIIFSGYCYWILQKQQPLIIDN